MNNARDKIEETIKSAAAIVPQYPSTGQAQYLTGSKELVLTLPSLNAQGLVIDNVYDYVVVHVDAQNSKVLRLRVFPDASSSRKSQNQVITTDLSKLTFYYFDSSGQIITSTQATKIGYIINLNQVIATNNQSSSASGQINLRNN